MDKPQTEHSAQTMDSGRVPFFRGIQFKYAVTYLLLIALVLLLLNTYPLLMAQNMVCLLYTSTFPPAPPRGMTRWP